jgi:hypothetical protein
MFVSRMDSESFYEEVNLNKVQTALATVAKLLHKEKEPVFAENVQHEYRDKFLLAEFLTSSAIGTIYVTLTHLLQRLLWLVCY